MPPKKTTKTIEQKRDDVVRVCKTIFDPELPFNVYDLGLIYDIAVDTKNHVTITMTLTTPMCPVADSLPGDIERRVKNELKWVKKVTVTLVWDPPWDISKMSPDARLFLGF